MKHVLNRILLPVMFVLVLGGLFALTALWRRCYPPVVEQHTTNQHTSSTSQQTSSTNSNTHTVTHTTTTTTHKPDGTTSTTTTQTVDTQSGTSTTTNQQNASNSNSSTTHQTTTGGVSPRSDDEWRVRYGGGLRQDGARLLDKRVSIMPYASLRLRICDRLWVGVDGAPNSDVQLSLGYDSLMVFVHQSVLDAALGKVRPIFGVGVEFRVIGPLFANAGVDLKRRAWVGLSLLF